MSTSVAILAPAKLNLFLRILGPRGDGFHDLETLFQAVGLHDRIVLTGAAEGVELHVEGAELGPPENNLAVRAARAFFEVADPRRGAGGVRIHLTKRIPAGAGLGGGSSDAAAVLRGLSNMVPEPPSASELLHIGARLGSDVPFFLGTSTLALATGRGERIEALAPLDERSVVVVLPPVHVATGRAYNALAAARATGAGPRRHEQRLPRPVPPTWAGLDSCAHNDFEATVPVEYPEVARSLAALRDRGGEPTLLAGSGGACFAFFSGAGAAEEAAEALTRELGWPALATHTLTRLPAPEIVPVE